MAKYDYKHVLDGFPYVENVDVYDYENTFDYNLWGVNTILRVLHVPWDISYEHVVEFETDEKRDEWVKDHTIKEYKLETAINVQPDGEIKLPIPFDVMSKCNYLVVEYPMSPVNYEKEDRISTVGYFINNVMQMAPSSTKCQVIQDYWFTYIHDVEITYMDLARGHAPMSKVNADKYLSCPIDNCEYLLSPDVNYGYTLSEYTRDRTAGTRVKQIAEWVANSGTIYAVLASTGNALLEWGTVGTDTMTTPSIAHDGSFGCSGFDYLAMKEEDLTSFIQTCNGIKPQYLQTVQGLFFVPEKLISKLYKFNWTGFDMDLYFIDTPQSNHELAILNKSNFGYPEKYEQLAKLYTDPYAQIEVSDEYGNISVIAVESTNGKIEINTELNLVYPFLGLDIIFVGLNGEQEDITEYGYSSVRSFSHSGEWYNNIRRYNIPSFIICQSQADRLKFDRYYPNKQKEVLYNTRYASDTDNADTRNTNALVGAQADKDNAYRSAQANYENTHDEAERDRHIRNSNSALAGQLQKCNENYANNMTDYAAKEYNAQRATSANSAKINLEVYRNQTLVTAACSGSSSTISSMGSLLSGSLEGLVNNVMSAATVSTITPIIVTSNETAAKNQAAAGIAQMQKLFGMSTAPFQSDGYLALSWDACYNGAGGGPHETRTGIEYDKLEKQILLMGQQISHTTYQINEELQNYYACLMGGQGAEVFGDDNPSKEGSGYIAADNFGQFYGIAPRLKDTANANADTTYNAASTIAGNTKALQYRDRDRDKNAAISDVDYGNKNQAVDAPAIYGNAMNSETAASRPLALFVNVRTQSDHAISAAGDQFCRYGYTLNKTWIPDKLQVMKHFTYWQTNDIWIRCRGNSVEEATEVLQEIFRRGTTVWSKPEDVNSVSIYDNI